MAGGSLLFFFYPPHAPKVSSVPSPSRKGSRCGRSSRNPHLACILHRSSLITWPACNLNPCPSCGWLEAVETEMMMAAKRSDPRTLSPKGTRAPKRVCVPPGPPPPKGYVPWPPGIPWRRRDYLGQHTMVCRTPHRCRTGRPGRIELSAPA